MADAAKGKVYPVHNNVFKFGIAGLESTAEQMAVPLDLENFAPSIDGTVEEWYSMDAKGWAKSSMTGKKLGFSFKGKRSVGDPGNDYIAGLAWKFGQDVMTKFEWTMVSGAKLACDVVDITDKLSFEGNPSLVIKGKAIEVNADAPTMLKVMGLMSADDPGAQEILEAYDMMFPERSKKEMEKLKLGFKDLIIVVQEAVQLISGVEEPAWGEQ